MLCGKFYFILLRFRMMNFKVHSHSVLLIAILFPISLMAEKKVFVDLTIQKIYAIENGKTIFEGRISSGKGGHETPTGNFQILQKKRKHESNLYPKPNGGAKMPYMMRLTWDGIAMHQGYVPKKPASHGCIRLQRRFAKKLFSWVNKGTTVTVAGDTYRYYDYGVSGNLYTKDRDGYAIIEAY